MWKNWYANGSYISLHTENANLAKDDALIYYIFKWNVPLKKKCHCVNRKSATSSSESFFDISWLITI